MIDRTTEIGRVFIIATFWQNICRMGENERQWFFINEEARLDRSDPKTSAHFTVPFRVTSSAPPTRLQEAERKVIRLLYRHVFQLTQEAMRGDRSSDYLLRLFVKEDLKHELRTDDPSGDFLVKMEIGLALTKVDGYLGGDLETLLELDDRSFRCRKALPDFFTDGSLKVLETFVV
jgi:hypothetical protein